MTTPDEQRHLLKIAAHEAAHGVVAVVLGVPLEALSVRAGATFHGVALLGPRSEGASREEQESRIIVTLAGDIGERAVPDSGYVDVSPDEVAAAAAVAELDARERLLVAEADEERWGDEKSAYWSSRILNNWEGDDVVSAHLAYLTLRATGLLRVHRRAFERVTQDLVVRSVLAGGEVADLTWSVRCPCHGWRPPPEKEHPATPIAAARQAALPPAPPERSAQVLSIKRPRVHRPLYVATTTGATELDGQTVAFVQGRTRIPAGHPLLAAVPSLFELDESGAGIVEPRYTRVEVPTVDSAVRLREPIPPERRMRCVRSLMVGIGHGLAIYEPGHVYDAHDPVVKKHRSHFEPATEDAPST